MVQLVAYNSFFTILFRDVLRISEYDRSCVQVIIPYHVNGSLVAVVTNIVWYKL